MNVVILSARQSSIRLPGKALIAFHGKTVLQHIVERYQTSKRIDEIIVATSLEKEDIAIDLLCEKLSIPCYRGSRDNLVARMNGALQRYAPTANYVFRGLGDMLLVDIGLLDWRFDLLKRRDADVVWTGLKNEPLPVYGSRESPWSRRAWNTIVQKSSGGELEHAGQWLYTHMHSFRVVYVEGPRAEYYSPVRLELDTPDDLRFFERVFAALHTGPGTPTTLTALQWLAECPQVVALNATVEEKSLTRIDWRKRGISWDCVNVIDGKKCGAGPLQVDVIRRSKLITTCPACFAERVFVEAPRRERR